MKTQLTIIAIAASALLASTEASAQFYPTEVGSSTTNTFPYCFVGKVHATFTTGGSQSSATTIKPYTALTAGHCVYKTGAGWAKSVSFEPAKYYASAKGKHWATRLTVVAGYTSRAGSGTSNTNAGFSYDAGAFLCSTRPNAGGYAGNWASPVPLTNTNYKMSLGYGAANHDGQQLLRSAPTRAFVKTSGAYFTNTTYRIEGGMSGGPVFVYTNGAWYVCAVNVSGGTTSGGVRNLDASTTAMMSNFY